MDEKPVTVKELVSTIEDLRRALDDASGVVDPSPDGTEEFAYQHELAGANAVLEQYHKYGAVL